MAVYLPLSAISDSVVFDSDRAGTQQAYCLRAPCYSGLGYNEKAYADITKHALLVSQRNGSLHNDWLYRLVIGLSKCTPVNVGKPLNTKKDDGTYSFSKDGLELYFASARPGGSGYYDL